MVHVHQKQQEIQDVPALAGGRISSYEGERSWLNISHLLPVGSRQVTRAAAC